MDGSQIDEVMQQQDGVEEGNEEEGAIVAASPDAPAARLMEGLQNHGESSERYGRNNYLFSSMMLGYLFSSPFVHVTFAEAILPMDHLKRFQMIIVIHLSWCRRWASFSRRMQMLIRSTTCMLYILALESDCRGIIIVRASK